MTLKPAELERYGIQHSDVVAALKSTNANAGGSVLRRGSMSFVIRGRLPRTQTFHRRVSALLVWVFVV